MFHPVLDDLNRTAHSATVVGSKVYILGGLDCGHFIETDMVIFDLGTDSWRILTFPEIAESIERFALHAHTTTLVNDQLVIIGGYEGILDGTVSDSIFTFDTVLEEFREVETVGSPARVRLEFHTANVLPSSDEIVVYAGQSADMEYYANPLFVYNATSRRWTARRWRGQVPPPRANHCSCMLHLKLYIFGGFAQEGVVLDDLHILDFNTKVPVFSQPKVDWTPHRRFGTSMFTFGGHVFLYAGKTTYAAGGDEIRLNDLHRFDVVEEQWNECPYWLDGIMPKPCSNHKAVQLHDRIVVFGGTSVNITTYVEISFEYD